jgi:hypothetical protein
VVKSNVIKSYFSRQDGDWWSVPLDPTSRGDGELVPAQGISPAKTRI